MKNERLAVLWVVVLIIVSIAVWVPSFVPSPLFAQAPANIQRLEVERIQVHAVSGWWMFTKQGEVYTLIQRLAPSSIVADVTEGQPCWATFDPNQNWSLLELHVRSLKDIDGVHFEGMGGR